MKKKKQSLWKEIKKNRVFYVMMAPYMIIFFVFTVLPVIISLFLSFTYFDIINPPKFVGLSNYTRLILHDEVFLIGFRNTMILAIIIGPVSYIASFLFAWLINELPPKIRWLLTVIFYAPSISGSVFLLWQLIFHGDMYGYLNTFLLRLGIIDNPVLWLKTPKHALWIIIVVQLWLSLGISFLSFIAGLQTVDKTLYEAGAIDGVRNRWQELWYITLPQMKSQLMFGALIQITASFSIGNISISLLGFPSVDYSGHTIITHLIDYGEIGITKIPETWDDVIDISPDLQKKYLEFYIPLAQGVLSETLFAMIEQNGGQLYLNGGREIGLLKPKTMEAFINFSKFFTDYGFPAQADFLNRFRSGEMPIGISSFTMYNSLAVFAPEIQGQWDYALLPGTKDKDGNINHTTTSVVSASVILKSTKYEKEAWEFLKWWHSEQVQLDYARGMEAILGAAARYPTANIAAFSQLAWPAKDFVLLQEQRKYTKSVPTVPGDYIVGRHIDNAFRLGLNENVIPQDSLYQYYLTINKEIARKRKDLGLD